jgi:glutathione S-transferase
MQQLTLHEDPFSGNCYKIRLTASFIGVEIHKAVQYDISKGETQTKEFRSKVNSNGRIPVLQVGSDAYLPESNAASAYLATGSWLIPSDPWEHAQMLRWMFFEQSSVEPTIGTIRYWYNRYGEASLSRDQKVVLSGKREAAESALEVMEAHLAMRDFLLGQKLTLCDIVLYAYVHLAADAAFDLTRWPSICTWFKRIENYPDYIRMNST